MGLCLRAPEQEKLDHLYHFQLVTVHSISMSELAVMNPKCYKSANLRGWGSGDVKTATLSPASERVVKFVCEGQI
jgi:hypothetical protein